MEKRNCYLLRVFILFIFISSLFFSCKTDKSLTLAIIEQTTNGKCTYTYPQYDKDNKTILRYCFTECDTCPIKDDIDNFNDSKEGKEKLSNELCPLNEENQERTSYVNANEITSNIIKNYIGDSTLQLKNLKGRELTVYEEIKNHKINVDPNSLKNNEVLKNCSRDFLFAEHTETSSLSVGSIVKTSEENNSDDESFLEEYGIGSYIYQYGSKDEGITHMVNGKITKLWNYYGDSQTFQNVKESIPSGWRLPRKDECNFDLVKSLKIRYKELDNKRYDRFWLSDIASPNTHYTCRIDTGTYSTSQNSHISLPIIIMKDRPDSFQSERFTSFKKLSKE